MLKTSVPLGLSLYALILICSALLAPAYNHRFVYFYSSLLQLILLIFLPAIISSYMETGGGELYPFKSVSLKTWGIILLCGFAIIPCLEQINYWQYSWMNFPSTFQEKIIAVISATSTAQFFGIFISMAVLPALCEEFFFRGFLFAGLGGYRRPWIGISLGALLFGLFHLNPINFFPATLAGLLFGFLRIQTGSLWPPIIVHFLINCWSILLVNTPLRSVIRWGVQVEPVPFPLFLGSVLFLLLGFSKLRSCE